MSGHTLEIREPADRRYRRATALLTEIISGITLYFDKALGNNLLYRFERAQYVEQKRSNPDTPMSEIYGAEHLLRLFGESSAYTQRGWTDIPKSTSGLSLHTPISTRTLSTSCASTSMI